MVRDQASDLCSTSELQQQRWRYFIKILNIQSHFDEAELESARQRPLRPHMADTPSREKLERAIGKMKNGKAGGSSGIILPEMVKAASCEDEFFDVMLDLVCTVWKESCVPKDSSDAVLVPIPKKGDLSNCDNWRGIALLDVVGKVVARVLQDYKSWLRMS